MKNVPGSATLTAAGGSLLVCLATPAALYLSADSRYAGAPPALRDSARKLLPCGASALCGLSGLLRFTRTEYDRRGEQPAHQITFELADIVDSIVAEMQPDALEREPELSALFAESLFQALAPVWAHFARQLDRPFGVNSAASGDGTMLKLAQLLYANRGASGRAFLCTIDLQHSIRRAGSGEYSSVLERPVVRTLLQGPVGRPRLFIRGKRSCACQEPVGIFVAGERQALGIIENIFRVTQQESRCRKSIGGPVDVAVIDGGGRRWLRQKPGLRSA